MSQTPEQLLQEESMKLAQVVAHVIHETGRGRRHPNGAYQETESPIITTGAGRKTVKLVGVMVPIELAAAIVGPAVEIAKAREAENAEE